MGIDVLGIDILGIDIVALPLLSGRFRQVLLYIIWDISSWIFNVQIGQHRRFWYVSHCRTTLAQVITASHIQSTCADPEGGGGGRGS